MLTLPKSGSGVQFWHLTLKSAALYVTPRPCLEDSTAEQESVHHHMWHPRIGKEVTVYTLASTLWAQQRWKTVSGWPKQLKLARNIKRKNTELKESLPRPASTQLQIRDPKTNLWVLTVKGQNLAVKDTEIQSPQPFHLLGMCNASTQLPPEQVNVRLPDPDIRALSGSVLRDNTYRT